MRTVVSKPIVTINSNLITCICLKCWVGVTLIAFCITSSIASEWSSDLKLGSKYRSCSKKANILCQCIVYALRRQSYGARDDKIISSGIYNTRRTQTSKMTLILKVFNNKASATEHAPQSIKLTWLPNCQHKKKI